MSAPKIMRQVKTMKTTIATKTNKYILAAVISAVIVILLLAAVPQRAYAAEKKLTITWFAVGDGDCIYINTPNHHKILVDGGTYKQGTAVLGKLKKKKVKKLDYVISTHSHNDHADGLYKITSEIPADAFVYNPYTSYVYRAEKNVSSRAIKLLNRFPEGHQAVSGEKIEFDDGVSIEFVSPPGRFYYSINKNALAMLITYGKHKALLTSDRCKGSQNQLRKEKVDIMDAPHHGSADGMNRSLLKKHRPESIVISAQGKKRNHPSKKALSVIAKYDKKLRVYRTYKCGDVSASVTENRDNWYFSKRGTPAGKAALQTK